MNVYEPSIKISNRPQWSLRTMTTASQMAVTHSAMALEDGAMATFARWIP